MSSALPKRAYRKRKRAQSEEETRRRITEAAVQLHGTVGPANTKMTELAKLAGVSRMTVYNHFPTDADLFLACSSHWATQNPFPDPSSWCGLEDTRERLVRALEELYGWYGPNQGMLTNVLRDAALVPALDQIMKDFWGGYMEEVVDALARGWVFDGEGRSEPRAMLRVVVDFNTWRILSTFEPSGRAAAELAAEMVVGGRSRSVVTEATTNQGSM